MSLLKDILYKVALQQVQGSTEVEINAVCFDSRKVEKGTLFVAIRGTQSDGHDYIAQAIEKGATAIVCEDWVQNIDQSIPIIQVDDSAAALGRIASNFYDNPSEKIIVVGVTGTNGKTTVATLLFELFKELGYTVGLLSTVENKINDEVLPATHTTPDAIALNALIAEMANRGCTHCFMEVSSHAIHQHRITGLDFDGGVFTNITHDHLDYHKTFDEYIKVKKSFFDQLSPKAFALVNGDDRRAMVMLQNTRASQNYFAIKTPADYKGKIISNTIQGLEVEINNQPVWFRLIGEFNAYNLLAVFGVAIELGEDEQEVLASLSNIEPINGRFNQIVSQQQIIGIVDYAHTPDALENVLKTITQLVEGNHTIITVVGCGGNRDKEKRPVMAEIACKLSDRVILTSDNPRNEEPATILQDMKEGVAATQVKKVLTLEDRKEAIKLACTLAEPNDVVLIAGKGHETYQEIKGERFHFDDKEELVAAFKLLGK